MRDGIEAMATNTEAARGRAADTPSEIPAAGWRDVLWRVKDEMAKDNLSLVAAGVAFYALLAIFPAIAAVVSIYGLVVDPQTVERAARRDQPGAAASRRAASSRSSSRGSPRARSTALGLGAILGLLLALWSANKGTQSLITALNIVYDEEEKRGFVRLTLISLGLTLGIILFLIVCLAAIAVMPALFGNLGLPEGVRQLASWLRWPILGLALRDRARGALPLRPEPRRAALALGQLGRGAGDRAVADRLGAVLLVRLRTSAATTRPTARSARSRC